MLISVPEAIEPVSGYTTGSVMHGQCDPISNVPSKLYAHAAASAPKKCPLALATWLCAASSCVVILSR